jgi:nucleotide-binding universal stress UspA family protein
MTAPTWMTGPPQNILLATDFSPRCDRALDRAAALASEWGAKLVALHVLETFDGSTVTARDLPSWRRSTDPVARARKELLADVGALAGRATVVIAEGDPVTEILHTAETEGCGLIVLGTARNELLGRVSLGRTVDRLLRRARVPVLVVRNRARAAYRKVVVATDFSASSRHALEAAARFLPGQKLTLFHAYDDRRTDSDSARRELRLAAARDMEAFLAGADTPAAWQRPDILIEEGAPSFLLRDYVQERGVDLVVLGTHGRGAIMELLIGSVATAVMDEVPCDALIIREPRAAVESRLPN